VNIKRKKGPLCTTTAPISYRFPMSCPRKVRLTPSRWFADDHPWIFVARHVLGCSLLRVFIVDVPSLSAAAALPPDLLIVNRQVLDGIGLCFWL